jgi:hypothetical protein
MKWVLLVYILTSIPVTEDLRQRRLEHPISSYAVCDEMLNHINYMKNYITTTPYPFVRSLYYHHVSLGDLVLGHCVYADPENIPECELDRTDSNQCLERDFLSMPPPSDR